jgi:hypothetical protein
VKHPSSVFALHTSYACLDARLDTGHAGFMATGTGTENLQRSFRKVVWNAIPLSRGLSLQSIHTAQDRCHKASISLKLPGFPRTQNLFFSLGCILCDDLALDFEIRCRRANEPSIYTGSVPRHSQRRSCTPRILTVVRDITSSALDYRNLHR